MIIIVVIAQWIKSWIFGVIRLIGFRLSSIIARPTSSRDSLELPWVVIKATSSTKGT